MNCDLRVSGIIVSYPFAASIDSDNGYQALTRPSHRLKSATEPDVGRSVYNADTMIESLQYVLRGCDWLSRHFDDVVR